VIKTLKLAGVYLLYVIAGIAFVLLRVYFNPHTNGLAVMVFLLAWILFGVLWLTRTVPRYREIPGWIGRLKPSWLQRKPKPESVTFPSIFEVFTTALDIVEMKVARSRLAGDPADVMITPLLPDFATMDFHRAKEAIAEGRAAVERMGPLIDQVIG
jgi:predicted acylesterase/phospholipase RssA